MERPEVLSVTVAVGRVVLFVDAIFRDTRHMHRFLSWAETITDSETHVVLDVHRSTLPIRERIRAVDEFLASTDEFLDKA